jgi:hypothetical protein
MKVNGARGEAQLSESVYAPLLDVLADHQVHTVESLESALAGRVNFTQLFEALVVLSGASHVQLAQTPEVHSQVRATAERLNLDLMQKARSSNEINVLASPLTSGAVSLDRIQQMFLLALKLGANDPAQWAQSAWSTLNALGQKLIREGKTLEDAQSNLAELQGLAREFQHKTLPILKAMGIA